MDIHTFIGNYREAFGQQAGLPIVFWYSDQPEAPAERVNGCFFKSMAQVRNEKIISLNAETIGCGGGKFYTGFTDMPEHVPGFVSLKEKYKKTPDMVVDFIQELQVPKAEKAYLHFARIDKIGSFDKVEGILFLATPDMLAGLATWAFFDSNATDTVSAPFGSGCCSVVTQAILENRKQGKRTFWGFFDPSVRPHFEAELLSFTIPMSRFKEMYHTMRESCLFDTHAWGKLKERIQDRQKETKPFNHLNVSFEIRPDIVLREVTVEDAAAIYRAIDTHRNYMRTWLPFVDNLKSVADEENFLKGVLSAPTDSYEPIFGIWNRENEICGLIGFHFFRLCQSPHGNRLLASARIPASGHHDRLCPLPMPMGRRNQNIKRIQIRCATGNVRK